MKMSESVNELFTAFAEFQGKLENASKDKQGHGYKYADLAECINTAKPILAENGLAVTQMLGMAQDGKQTLITMLTHKSGQYISSEFVMVDAKLMGGAGNNPAQVLGSAITYQRRYAYAAIIGLAQEDDDAANVGKPKNNQLQQAQNQQPQTLSQKQIADLTAHIQSNRFTVEAICKSYNIGSLSQFRASQYQDVINQITTWANQAQQGQRE